MKFPVAATLIVLLTSHFSMHSIHLPSAVMAFVPLAATAARSGAAAASSATSSAAAAIFFQRHSRRSFVGAATYVASGTGTTTTCSASLLGTNSDRCRGNYHSALSSSSSSIMASSTTTIRGGAATTSSSALFSNTAATDAETATSGGEPAVADAPKEIFRNDYKPLPYKVTNISMNFDIQDGHTIVTSDLTIVANPDSANNGDEEWVFDGEAEALTLQSVEMNAIPLQLGVDYKIEGDALIILPEKVLSVISNNNNGADMERMVLTTRVQITPETNTQLSGLYKSGSMYCTQCEAMGFRRITYYPDRPDNMAIFDKVRIEANKELYPVLLGNGNKIEEGAVVDDDGKRHFATWSDPFPKPSYLFCIVVCSQHYHALTIVSSVHPNAC